MLMNQTLDKLRTMRLTGMADSLEQQLGQANIHDLSFEERFALLVDHELLYRDNRRLARLLKAAKLRVDACVEDIDYRHRRGLKRPEIASLATCEWITQRHNLTLTGPTGTGKTWLCQYHKRRNVAAHLPDDLPSRQRCVTSIKSKEVLALEVQQRAGHPRLSSVKR